MNRDIYTHVTYAELDDKTGRQEDGTYRKGKKYQMSIGDTITTSNSLVILESLNKDVDKNALMLKEGDIAIGARLLIMDVNRKIHYAEPVFVIRENSFFNRTAEINELGLKFAFEKILPEENKMEIDIAEKEGNVREFVIMKAIIFPQINILWTGCILMIIGTWIAIVKRIRQLKAQQVQ
ncbi:MAG: hypothetical protein IPP46_18680 [Bacteroidetes bacterium]|nr:hypothetical protein [Bacteroidota bacterium]